MNEGQLKVAAYAAAGMPMLAYFAVMRERDALREAESYNETLTDLQSAMLLLPRSWLDDEED